MTQRDEFGDFAENEDAQHCIIYWLKAGAEFEYDRHHANVWPEVESKLRAEGFYDYSIFRRGDLVISVYRKRESSNAAMTASVAEVNKKWSSLMGSLLLSTTDETGAPLSAARVFRLE